MAKLEHSNARHETVLDVTQEQIARVYAKAFLEVAVKSPRPGDLVDEVAALVGDLLNRIPRLEEMLRSALVSREDKEQLIGRIFDQSASVQVVNFLKVLARHGRLELLRPIARILSKLYAQRSGLTEVEVRVARDLDKTVQNQIQERLRKVLGREPVLSVIVDTSLIAGLWVRVGDRVYDGSIRTRLEYARRQMIDRATERIEAAPERFVSGTM